MPSKARSLLVLLMASAATVVAGCARRDEAWEVHGTLERDRLELVAESNEQIIDIPVKEGDRVAAGDVVARQEAGTMQPRLDQARASVDEAGRRLAELQSGPRQREIEEARAALAGAESALETEAREFARVQSLVERKLVSATTLDQAQARRDAARSSRDQAVARLKLLQEGTRIEQLQQAQAVLTRSRAALSELETMASRYVVHAPRPGTIEALPYKLGERPPAGAPVVVMLADGTPYARVHVPETLRAQFTAGSRVLARVDGIAEPLAGTVRYISAEAAFTPYYALTQKDRTRLSYLAEIALDDARAAALPAGVPVQVTLPQPSPGTP
jgi:HlyD family secretion protein